MNTNNEQPGNPAPKFNFGNNRFALIFLLVLIGMLGVIFLSNTSPNQQKIPYSQFLSYLEEGQVRSVQIIDQSEVVGWLKNSQVQFQTNIPYFDNDLIVLLKERGVEFTGTTKPTSPLQILLNFLPWVVILLFSWFMFRQVQGSGNRAFSFSRASVKRYLDDGKKVTFNDVAGSREAKYELEEIIDFLKSPEKFTMLGARVPKGVLLVGMPGTGKTLLAKATAGEADVSFFHMSGSDFVEMFVGVGASRVRDLFSVGKKSSPCVIFIDELDAVGRTRGAGYGGGHDEREQTLNQMLVEMDGFETTEGVIVLAATNRPDVLDPALLRPGRFDRQVYVDLPDQKEREDILKLHAKKLPLGDVDLSIYARAVPGSSGADLANLVNEAALFASRRGSKKVDAIDFEEARDKIIMGLARSSRVITDEEKIKTSRHEAGHTLLHYFLPNADPLHKVTIIPRGRALGAAFSLPERDFYSRGSGYLRDRVKICFGGYVAETLFYKETSTGVQADLKQATDLARKMVIEWGMSKLGPISFGQEDEPIFLGKEIATHKDYSDTTALDIDREIQAILKDCYQKAYDILQRELPLLETLATHLSEKETLSDKEIQELLKITPLRNNHAKDTS